MSIRVPKQVYEMITAYAQIANLNTPSAAAASLLCEFFNDMGTALEKAKK